MRLKQKKKGLQKMMSLLIKAIRQPAVQKTLGRLFMETVVRVAATTVVTVAVKESADALKRKMHSK